MENIYNKTFIIIYLKFKFNWVFCILSRSPQFSSVQSLSRVRLFATPWIAARQSSLSITNSWSSPNLMSIESVMPSRHLILCLGALVTSKMASRQRQQMLPILIHYFRMERALDKKSGADLWGDLGQAPLFCHSFLKSRGYVKKPCLPPSQHWCEKQRRWQLSQCCECR